MPGGWGCTSLFAHTGASNRNHFSMWTIPSIHIITSFLSCSSVNLADIFLSENLHINTFHILFCKTIQQQKHPLKNSTLSFTWIWMLKLSSLLICGSPSLHRKRVLGPDCIFQIYIGGKWRWGWLQHPLSHCKNTIFPCLGVKCLTC